VYTQDAGPSGSQAYKSSH